MAHLKKENNAPIRRHNFLEKKLGFIPTYPQGLANRWHMVGDCWSIEEK